MDLYLKDLLERMVFNKNEIGLFKNSSLAYKECKNLSNKDYIKDLVDFIKSKESQKNKEIRKNAYYVLGNLLSKFHDIKSLNFFISQLRSEKDKYILSGILDSLSNIEKEESVDLTPIIDLLKSEKWLIRHSAINALKKSKNPIIRNLVLDIISVNFSLAKDKQKYDKNSIIYSTTVLYEVGIFDDILLLEELKTLKIADIKGICEIAIKYITSRHNGEEYKFEIEIL